MIFLTVAVIMVVAVTLTACNGNAFKPVEMPAQGEVSSNGGSAVRYGEWIYYINGYESNSSAANTYEQIETRLPALRLRISKICLQYTKILLLRQAARAQRKLQTV